MMLAIVGLLCIGIPSLYAIPQVKLIPSDAVYFWNEGSLTLICTVDMDVRISSVTFKRDTLNYVGILNPSLSQCNATKYSVNDTFVYNTYCDKERNFTLVKRGTDAEDNRKNWTCIINSLAGGPCVGSNNPCVSQSVTAIVRDAIPQVTLFPDDVAYFSNEGSLTLICTVDQDVQINSVTFKRDRLNYVAIFNPTLSQCTASRFMSADTSVYSANCVQERNFTLIKHKTNAENHRTRWTCVMNSLAGGPCFGGHNPCLSENVTAILQVPVTIVQLTDGTGKSLSSPVSVVDGTATVIRCNTSPNGSRPLAMFRWFKKHGNQLATLIENQSLSTTSEIETVPGQTEQDLLISYSTMILMGNKSLHSFYIFCTAQNDANNGSEVQSEDIQLDIQYGPTISYLGSIDIEEGDTLTVTCNVSANPPAVVSWTRSGKITSNKEVLKINFISRNDSGVYTCTVSNVLEPTGQSAISTNASDTLKINVLYGPGNSTTINPNVMVYEVEEGKTAQDIVCSAMCNPECSYKWLRNNTQISNQDTLSLGHVHRNIIGRYVCEAYNTVKGAIQSSTVLIEVMVKSDDIFFNHSDLPIAAIVSGTVGGTAGMIIIIVSVFCIRRRCLPGKHGMSSRSEQTYQDIYMGDHVAQSYDSLQINDSVQDEKRASEHIYKNTALG